MIMALPLDRPLFIALNPINTGPTVSIYILTSLLHHMKHQQEVQQCSYVSTIKQTEFLSLATLHMSRKYVSVREGIIIPPSNANP